MTKPTRQQHELPAFIRVHVSATSPEQALKGNAQHQVDLSAAFLAVLLARPARTLNRWVSDPSLSAPTSFVMQCARRVSPTSCRVQSHIEDVRGDGRTSPCGLSMLCGSFIACGGAQVIICVLCRQAVMQSGLGRHLHAE